MIKNLIVIYVLVAYMNNFVNSQAFQGGTLNYRILKNERDSVTIRFFHKLLKISALEDKEKACGGNCLSSLIEAEEFRYKNLNTTLFEKPYINASFYCDAYYNAEEFAVGSLETDVKLSKNTDAYEFSYAECCSFDDLTYNKLYKQGKFNLKVDFTPRIDNQKLNNVPNTKNVPLYIEMTQNSEFKFEFPDADNDEVRCEWSSNICEKGNCNQFDLTSDCKLKSKAIQPPQFFQLGILVKDYYMNLTNYTTSISSVPVNMIVKVTSSVSNSKNATECPANRIKPIQNESKSTNSTNSLKYSLSIIFSLLILFFNKF